VKAIDLDSKMKQLKKIEESVIKHSQNIDQLEQEIAGRISELGIEGFTFEYIDRGYKYFIQKDNELGTTPA